LLPIALLYVALTFVGLYPFRGIPILNVALGFPIGALVAWRTVHPPGAADAAGPGWRGTLRRVLSWALATAGITMLVCWLELAGSLIALHLFGGDGPARWLPLGPGRSSPHLFRAQLFAVMISPGLQLLTTVFGGVITLVLRGPEPAAPEGPPSSPANERVSAK
jgi:hypothetical protein